MNPETAIRYFDSEHAEEICPNMGNLSLEAERHLNRQSSASLCAQ